ncbi:MAG: type VI secretion system tube protein Hcp [Telluria sp.]
MATDVYLEIEGIKGESSDLRHEGWIECRSAHWGAFQPKSASGTANVGDTAERGELSDITITKLSDVATPLLLQTCMMGRIVRKAKLEFHRADGQGTPVKYFEIELENVVIGQVTPSISEGELLTETVSLKFSKVKWKYTQQKILGGACGYTNGGWNLSTNRCV